MSQLKLNKFKWFAQDRIFSLKQSKVKTPAFPVLILLNTVTQRMPNHEYIPFY